VPVQPSPIRAARAPYAVEPTEFRFPALAAAAGRAPLGGARETALAVFLAARLVDDAIQPTALPVALRAQRAVAARNWIASVALSAPVRRAVLRLVDASEAETAAGNESLPAAVQGVTSVTANLLAPAAHLELEQFGASLRHRVSGH
jgi:hypothetical protein